ncbi:MobC family plasmid mobilization relaxosome protein [Acetobacter cerevisiae]|uniref:MobC family plasmid mobilization relaxosome protein n=1 Tax=Acetobacter cerevisiae TaxID=178900 RepID=UPI00209E9760|nr:MobC family plasmid mobilization relaxosome protein [Acetobacter cerevisiae]MCP1270625.1 MobC family plasmid mobilization relaxosome protein [Acetobacter cerevisiae]MCP1278579.1 MobC family plasmid mobilization relaxosome protein [Acetobacter cerevisiae]
MRKETIHIRIDDAEKHDLMRFAKATGHGNLSTWTRYLMSESVALGRDGTALLSELTQLRREINGIGNNLNQIAKLLHSGKSADADFSDVHRVSSELQRVIKRIRPIRYSKTRVDA